MKTFVKDGIEVTAVQVTAPADVVEVRATEWPEGQLAVLTYPTSDPAAYIGVNTPLSAFGVRVAVGNWLVKGPAGDLHVMPDAVFRNDFEEKVA